MYPYFDTVAKGLCKVLFLFLIQDNFGSGWVGPGLTWKKKKLKIILKQSYTSLLVPIFWGNITYMSIRFVCTLLKVVSY